MPIVPKHRIPSGPVLMFWVVPAVCLAVRLVIPRHQFTDLLDVTVGETWRYGSDAAQVPDRLRRMLTDLDEVARPEHREAVRHWIGVVAA